jgi:hypothetical protein
MVIPETHLTLKRKLAIYYQMNVIITFVLLTAEVIVFCLKYCLLFAGFTIGLQNVAELDGQSVQQSPCLDKRDWVL